MALDFLDPVFGPILKLPPILGVFLIAFTITLAITLVYKFTTDQKKMKKLKDELKESQNKIKTLSKEDPKKALEIQQQMMQKNMEYMKHSFKSTLYTMLPILLIFAWLNSHMAYYPIMPDQEFKVTALFADGHAATISLSSIPDLIIIGNSTQMITENTAVWTLKGSAGDYKLQYEYNNEKYEQELLITDVREYAPPDKIYSDSKLKKTAIGNIPIRPFGAFSLFGWHPGWLGTYIIISLIVSMLLRKLMKVY
jgi:prepilin-type processing-associated H-X9-DG protein